MLAFYVTSYSSPGSPVIPQGLLEFALVIIKCYIIVEVPRATAARDIRLGLGVRLRHVHRLMSCSLASYIAS